MTKQNIDLGRPVSLDDILDDDTFPIGTADSGGVYCYECQGPHKGSIGGLSALTTSSGVFTSSVRCAMDAAVYMCLEHAPGDRTFGAFHDDVRSVLLTKLDEQRTAETNS